MMCSQHTRMFFNYKKSFPRTMQLCIKLLVLLLCLLQCDATSHKTRFTRAVMLSIASKKSTNCLDETVMEKNATASIILTGTVTSCEPMKAGSYVCSVQIWRVMKGGRSASDLIEYMDQGFMKSVYKRKHTSIYGLGNTVQKDDTRIFFLNRKNNRLVLATSLLRITLTNLENTQAVIEGKKVIETPKKPPNACMEVLCGYGATCKVAGDGNATCVCPPASCSTSDEVFAPVCGSNGVTYPNQCRLKAAQCLTQRRIGMLSNKACAPAVDNTVCQGVICGNSAVCVVRLQPDGSSSPSCVCPTCDDVPTSPLCGSDQRSHRSACDLQRMACLESKNITILRRSPCNPCDVFNETTREFESTCPGDVCSLDEAGQPRCCNTIACAEPGIVVCGSDGNTYESECALTRFACKTAKTLSVLKVGPCPDKKPMTTVRGSVGIDSNSNCPGGCDPGSAEFQAFTAKLQADVNVNLKQQNFEDIDAKTLGGFQFVGNRTGSVVLLFRAYASTQAQPIGLNDLPGAKNAWMLKRLFDPAKGALFVAARDSGVAFVPTRDPADDFIVEDVCLGSQCTNGAACSISTSGADLEPSCSCDKIGDGDRLAVTLACKQGSDGANHMFFDNAEDVRRATCARQVQITFKDVCAETTPNPCESLGGCRGEGESCVVTNGRPMCTCITCGTEYKPVCTANGETFRSACEVRRHKCVTGNQLEIAHDGECADKCDQVQCGQGELCEVNAQGATCVCPTECSEAHSPVCGSDGMTYDNECQMVVAACATKTTVTVERQGACDVVATDETQNIEGSGGCSCKYGAVCVGTSDDEDSPCICKFDCSKSSRSEVCGSDRRTYPNACELRKAQCETQTTIKIAGAGSCHDVCSRSAYGCCDDGITPAGGLRHSGCPETCDCHPSGSFASTCHPTTGQCVCRPGVGGLKCDRCLPGYWNFWSVVDGRNGGCMSCSCNPLGSTRDDCDQMTGRCSCKDNVIGSKCAHCAGSDGNPTWITADLCEKTASTVAAKSCADLSCRFGQECVEVRGVYECKCPSFASCDSFNGASVCGSNGVTYADACQMKVMACKQGIDVKIAGEGPCERTPEKPEPPTAPPSRTPAAPAPSPEPEPEPEPEPATILPKPETATELDQFERLEKKTGTQAATTFATTRMPEPSPPATTEPEPVAERVSTPGVERADSTTTTLVVTETPTAEKQPDGDVEGSGPRDHGCMGDDEDCGRGSGDAEINEMSGDETPTPLTEPDRPTAAPVSYHGSATLYEVGDDQLQYSSELKDPTTELFNEYEALITQEFWDLAHDENLAGKIKSFRINSYESRGWFRSGLVVKFDIGIVPGVDPSVIASTLTELAGDNTFTIDKFEGVDYKPTASPDDYSETEKWTVPQFGGASYAEYPRVESFSTTTINMSLRSFDPEGLLLYAYLESRNDFLSLAINLGYLEFSFNVGSGKVVLRSRRPIDDSRWHTIIARRNRKDGMLQVDDESPVQGTSPGESTGLNLDSLVYVGGFRNTMQDRVQEETGVSKGLTGCIRHLAIDGEVLSLNSTSGNCLEWHRIADCRASPCFPNPCKNSANCFITKQADVFTNKCQCTNRYEGSRCEREATKPRIDPCLVNLCHSSSQCVANTGDDGYTCQCPAGRSGSLCEDGDEFDGSAPNFMPAFAQDSYMQVESLNASNVESEMTVEILFYASLPDGLIFYNGQRKSAGRSSHDYVSLNLKDAHLEFMYDLGQGPAKIRSPSAISLNQWHAVRVSRSMRHGELTVDSGEVVHGQSPKNHSQLNLNQPLYLGGVPDYSNMPPSSGITVGLAGALQMFEVNGLRMPLTLDSSKRHHNVRAFNGHACFHNPCQNGATCFPQAESYTCQCTAGYAGKHCDAKQKANTNKNILQDQGATAVYFDGKTKAKYRNAIKARSRALSHNVYELVLRTTAGHGLLLMAGKAVGNNDYLAVAISDGRVHLRFNLGSGAAHLVSEDRINDGTMAVIKVERKYNKATLQVNNGMPQTVTSPGPTRNLNTDGVLWLGGVDYQPRGAGLYKSFFHPLVGCVSSLKIHAEPVRIREDALNAPQLRSCLLR